MRQNKNYKWIIVILIVIVLALGLGLGLGLNLQKNDSCQLYRPSKYVYRLGDMTRLSSEQKKKEGADYHLKHFPNSIVSEYLRRTQEIDNYDILSDIVMKRSKKISIPEKNTVVLHLRVGDVIEMSKHNVNTFLTKPTLGGIHKIHYTPSISQIMEALAKFSDINTIIIVAGSHINCDTTKSCLYLAGVRKHLEKNGYKVSMRLGGDPDEDFIFMCLAHNFISSGGMYSTQIYNTRNKIHGKDRIHSVRAIHR